MLFPDTGFLPDFTSNFQCRRRRILLHYYSLRLGEALLYISRTGKASIPDAFVIAIHDLESKIDHRLYLLPTEFLAVIGEGVKRF